MTLEVSGGTFVLRSAHPIASADGDCVRFHPTRVVAEFLSEVEPRYWVVPLLNFVSSFVLATPDLQRHPLRTRETPPLQSNDADTADADTARYHELAYRQANALIPFDCEGEPGFIEPLPDYDERKTSVDAGKTTVTSVMVGRLPPGFVASEPEVWFPSDLVTLLGLATGRSVAVPFVELRGPSGELAARMHVNIGSPSTQRRTALIDESVDRSTGALLSAFLGSQHRGKTWLRVVLGHLLRAFTGDMTVEDRLGHLFRAAEGLAVGLKLTSSRPLEVEPEIGEGVTEALENCIDQLETLASDATATDRERIERLANRIRDVKANRPSFQRQLLELVEYARLPDAQWLREFSFRAKIGGQPTSWFSAASQYRNRIFHSAFIDLEKYELDNIVAFIAHLEDVLTRVVFHLIGFESRYKPPCGAYGTTTHVRPDWARPERLSPGLLRYVA